ncbi:MAG: protease modulator HflC [Lachnospiraceae bacterium]|nr:protease modulator HflC [Lachnospiraceae bacterium]
MKKILAWITPILIILIIVGSSCVVVTQEDEYTLVRQFGKISTIHSEAGLSFKMPFVQSVDVLPKKLMIYDLPQSDVITKDKKTMIADSYILWEISDPLLLAQTLNSSVSAAEGRIDAVVYNAMKNVISSMNQTDVINSRAGDLDEKIMASLSTSMDQYGITIISVQTKRLDLPDDNKAAVYERMISERSQMAATYTAEGEADAQVIRNTADKDVAISLSNAQAQAAAVEAQGEAEYMRILAEAYGDAGRQEFYSFYRSIEALKTSFASGEKTIILPADSPVAKLFLGY